MKKFIWIIFKYSMMFLPLGLALAFLEENESLLWLSVIVTVMEYVLLYFMLNELGKLIKSEDVRKLYTIAIRILTAELIIAMFALYLLNIYPSIEWWISPLILNIIFLTFAIMLFKIARSLKDNELIGCLLYAIFLGVIIIIIITNIILLVGVN
ncbi:MAG: hypothetical protein LBC71_03290 [Oscillospiraceae bacterium]|jgi:hypothetical protein|nr:hypothetical protein [Oscillospiraceae bacterium]